MSHTQADIQALAWVDPHEARARELDRIGDLKRARKIRACGRRRGAPQGLLQCKWRFCTSCGEIKSWDDATKDRDKIQQMADPVYLTTTLKSRGLDDLRETTRELRANIGKLRKHQAIFSVVSAVGRIEPKLAICGVLFNVHAHTVFDASIVNVSALQEVWDDLTEGRGRLLQPRGALRVSKRGVWRVAAYDAKSQDWCPTPGTLSMEQFNALHGGLLGTNLSIAWGPVQNRGRKKRKR